MMRPGEKEIEKKEANTNPDFEKDKEKITQSVPPLDTKKIMNDTIKNPDSSKKSEPIKRPDSPLQKMFSLFQAPPQKERPEGKQEKAETKKDKRAEKERQLQAKVSEQKLEKEYQAMLKRIEAEKKYKVMSEAKFKRRSADIGALLAGAPLPPVSVREGEDEEEKDRMTPKFK